MEIAGGVCIRRGNMGWLTVLSLPGPLRTGCCPDEHMGWRRLTRLIACLPSMLFLLMTTGGAGLGTCAPFQISCWLVKYALRPGQRSCYG